MVHQRNRPSPDGTEARGLSGLTAEHGLLYGGDYNPEQWPETVWEDDVTLMRDAGVSLVTVGVFSWAQLEPSPGARDFGWLDRVLDLLHTHGIAVDLATPTASPPPWMGHRWPETLPVDADGVRLAYGSRNQFSPASAVYRRFAREITRDLAERYATHPAVRMWHVGNELGQVCRSDESAQAFRAWLRARYGTLDDLNEAWGTTFWSQRYDEWDEIIPPRRAPYLINPTQELDFRRYSSDALLEVYREQRDIIRSIDPVTPITTNFMGFFPLVDYWSWAGDLDVVADDAYPDPTDPDAPSTAALTQDLMRSLGSGAPWLLMEQAVSSVNWRDHNVPKSPDRMRLESLQAVARGADGICFFQWRASRAGAERFHSAMLPHAGPDTDVHRGIRRLGADLRALRAVVGTRVDARVAIVFDWSSWWAAEEAARPTTRLQVLDQVRSWYRPLWERGIAVDLVHPSHDLGDYALVLAPNLYLLGDDDARALDAYVADGGALVVGPFSAVATPDAHVRTGRFPVPLADVVGVSGEEWLPLPEQGTTLGSELLGPVHVKDYAERLRAHGARVVAHHGEGAPLGLAGTPAVTVHDHGDGSAWYVGVLLPERATAALLGDVCAAQGIDTTGYPGVESVRRGDLHFLLNHSDTAVTVNLPPGEVTDLLTLSDHRDEIVVGPVDAVVLIERSA
ncbi:beta-galactosidase [Sanguibacter sp. 25GB23B1]|uniref:beta-galactosidase n=1 Tax=unclassified Sanguibacter TaxID=2645534 RepID=UPI0032AFA6B3